jgi:hypothetical protein
VVSVFGRWIVAGYESEKELRKAVEKHTGSLSDEDWEMATLDLVPYTAYDEGDLESVLRNLEEMGIQPQPKRYTTLEGAERKAQLEAEKEAEFMRHSVKTIREKVFGDPSPPFETMDAADDWILTEAEKQGGGEVVGSLEYGGRNHVWRRVEVRSGSPLETLWRTTLPSFQIIPHRHPDWRWHRALALVLTDEVIPVGPYQYSYSPGHEYTITIRSPDVSNQFIGELCQALRIATWRVKAPSGRTPDQVERAFHLAEFMKRTTHLTWDERRKKWKQEYPQWAFDSKEQMLMAFKRAISPTEYRHWKEKVSGGPMPPAHNVEDVVRIIETERAKAEEMDERENGSPDGF